MKDIERRKYEMFLRVREFGARRAAEFPESSLGRELLNRLDAVVTALDEHAAAQTSRRGGAQEGAAGKAAARDELRRDLEAISRTARALAIATPGLENKFRAPRSVSDQALLWTARAFAADALPLKTEFTRRGLPEDFLEDLSDDIEAFEQSITGTIREREAQVAATAAIDDSIERGANAVSELDVIVRNRFAADAATLAAWLSASHTQRPPRRAHPGPNATPPAAPPAPN